MGNAYLDQQKAKYQELMQIDQPMKTLLHSHECPVGYQCMSNDCEECVKIHMEEQKDSAASAAD